MESTVTKCDECGYLSKDTVEGNTCLACNGTMQIDYVIDKSVSCTTCKTHDGAWIYCPILPNMLVIDGFDETGELHGCNAHNGSVNIDSEVATDACCSSPGKDKCDQCQEIGSANPNNQ